MNEKEKWIIDYIKNSEFKSVNILDEKFVEDFISEFNVKYKVVMIGAYRCSYLSRLLSTMYKKGLLKRYSLGLRSGAWQDGFPKWIYCYELK